MNTGDEQSGFHEFLVESSDGSGKKLTELTEKLACMFFDRLVDQKLGQMVDDVERARNSESKSSSAVFHNVAEGEFGQIMQKVEQHSSRCSTHPAPFEQVPEAALGMARHAMGEAEAARQDLLARSVARRRAEVRHADIDRWYDRACKAAEAEHDTHAQHVATRQPPAPSPIPKLHRHCLGPQLQV